MQQRGVSGGQAVDMQADEHVVVKAVDRVVESHPMQPNVDPGHVGKRLVVHQHVADLVSDSLVDALLLAAQCHRCAVRITEQQAHLCAGRGPSGHQLDRPRILLRQKVTGEHEHVDLLDSLD